jgi:hypothetical protein
MHNGKPETQNRQQGNSAVFGFRSSVSGVPFLQVSRAFSKVPYPVMRDSAVKMPTCTSTAISADPP